MGNCCPTRAPPCSSLILLRLARGWYPRWAQGQPTNNTCVPRPWGRPRATLSVLSALLATSVHFSQLHTGAAPSQSGGLSEPPLCQGPSRPRHGTSLWKEPGKGHWLRTGAAEAVRAHYCQGGQNCPPTACHILPGRDRSEGRNWVSWCLHFKYTLLVFAKWKVTKC